MTGTFVLGLALLGADPKVELSEPERLELHRAMAAPALDRLDAILRKHPELLTRPVGDGGETVLREAATWRWPEVAEHLRRRGAAVDMYSAVALGWDDEVRRLAKADPKALAPKRGHESVLDATVFHNRPGTLKLLLDLGARIKVPQADDEADRDNVLASAVERDRPQLLRLLLDRTDDRVWGRLGPGALATACMKPREETETLLGLLLARKPPLMTPTWDGPGCLRTACIYGNVAAVRMLLKAGVPPDGYPPPDRLDRVYDPLVRVAYAARNLNLALRPRPLEGEDNPPAPDPATVGLAEKIWATNLPGLLFPFAGASARTREEMGMAFPLHLAGVSDEIADDRVRTEIADLLIRAGAEWDFPAAVAFGKTDVVRKMLAADPRLTESVMYRVITHPESWRQGRRVYDVRPDRTRQPWEGWDGTHPVYPVEAAAVYGHTDIVRLLMARTPDKLPENESPIMSAFSAAAKAGRAETMKALLAEPKQAETVRKRLSQWAWGPAARSGSTAVLDVLAGLRKPAEVEVNAGLLPAVEAGHLPAVRRLVELGGPLTPDQAGWLLRPAAEHGHLDLVRWLLDHGASPSWGDGRGDTPLHAAAQKGQTLCLKALLDHKAKVDARGNRGCTPLLAAAATGESEAFDILLAAGADRRAVDNEKNTALHLAAQGGSLEVVEQLLRLGADQSARNVHGDTPVGIAWQVVDYPDPYPPKPRSKVYFRLEAAARKK